MKKTYFDTQGRFIKNIDSSEEMSFTLNAPPEEHFIVDGLFYEDCYYSKTNLEAQKYPSKPSRHHVFNHTTEQWEDSRTLIDLRAEKWRNIKANRDAAEHGGFEWDGSVFDSDVLSQQRITGAVTLAQMSPAFTTVWTLADNSTRALSAADMFAVGMALGTHVATQFLQGQLLRAQIEESVTKEEVEAVVW